jgi:CDGSH-type Zn-finger protein
LDALSRRRETITIVRLDVTTIRLRRNGPYVIEGDVRVVDWNGVEYASDRMPIALCRCGASTKKPFCDGTHSRIGFQAAEEAVGPEAQDRPAD